MQKVFLTILICALIGYAAYDHRAAFLGKGKPVPSQAAGATAKPVAGAVAHPPVAKAAAPTLRAQIEPLLKPLKVTSILLGEPSIVIIDKKDYSVGDTVPLAGGRKAQVAGINEAGVTLTCEHENFHLDAPAAPDLDAIRKKS